MKDTTRARLTGSLENSRLKNARMAIGVPLTERQQLDSEGYESLLRESLFVFVARARSSRVKLMLRQN
jgi:hypothetical protein